MALGSLLLVSGCGSGSAFASSTEDASMQPAFLSKPAALGCAVDELSAAQLRDAMHSAFGDASNASVMTVLTGFAERSPGAAHTRARAVGRLLGSLDEADPGKDDEEAWADGWGEARQHDLLALRIHSSVDGVPPGYRTWLAAQPADVRADRGKVATDYIKHLEDARNDTADQRLSETMGEISGRISTARRAEVESASG